MAVACNYFYYFWNAYGCVDQNESKSGFSFNVTYLLNWFLHQLLFTKSKDGSWGDSKRLYSCGKEIRFMPVSCLRCCLVAFEAGGHRLMLKREISGLYTILTEFCAKCCWVREGEIIQFCSHWKKTCKPLGCIRPEHPLRRMVRYISFPSVFWRLMKLLRQWDNVGF